MERAEQALDSMDDQLKSNDWLVGDAMTIADIALLAYTRLAPEGGFDLSARVNLTGWIDRCKKKLGL